VIIKVLVMVCLSYVSFFGPIFRAYYTIKDGKIIFLLCGGDKRSQGKDIDKARIIMDELE